MRRDEREEERQVFLFAASEILKFLRMQCSTGPANENVANEFRTCVRWAFDLQWDSVLGTGYATRRIRSDAKGIRCGID